MANSELTEKLIAFMLDYIKELQADNEQLKQQIVESDVTKAIDKQGRFKKRG